MTRTRRGAHLTVLLTLVAVVTVGSQIGEGRGADPEPLPTASDLVVRHLAAVGGRDAVLAPASSRRTARFEVPAAGVTGTIELLSMKPNLAASVLSMAGIGEFRSGFDGEVGWSIDPVMGARLHEGRELLATRDLADTRAAVRDPNLFDSMVTVELTEFGEVACYRVELVWRSGRQSSDCYCVETGLLVATVSTHETPMGSVEVVELYSDYQRFGDAMFPTRAVSRMMGQEQIVTLERVEFDTVDGAAFALPPEIRTLVDAESQAS
jgi:hypothetical protein